MLEQNTSAAPSVRASLIPVSMEIASGQSYRWVDGFKVINPKGHELQPYMRKREARAFCKAQGWKPSIDASQGAL
jgi:hypothetical protein